MCEGCFFVLNLTIWNIPCVESSDVVRYQQDTATQNRIRKEAELMKKTMDRLTICHLILMGLMCILSCVSAVIIFSGNIPKGYEVFTEAHKTASYITGAGHIFNVLAIICGIVYMVKGSGKNVAGVYKTFLLLVTIGLALRFAARFFHPGFDVIAGLMIGSLLMLLILTFGKDLGRTKTWSVFHVLIALDIAIAILMFDSREALSSIASGLTRLVLDGTIGLAIRAKYADKAARGK